MSRTEHANDTRCAAPLWIEALASIQPNKGWTAPSRTTRKPQAPKALPSFLSRFF